jgi:ATP-dependent DNA helicase RecQ
MTTLALTPASILQHYYGYSSFRPLQEDIIQSVLDGRDTVVIMPTGGGKSICFQIPALLKDGVCIVVSPLLALMKDQVEALHVNGIGAAALNSTTHPGEAQNILMRCQKGEIKLIYVSPEKLITDLAWLKQQFPISMVAIDEAHCISSWGHDFRPEYTQLHTIKTMLPDVPVMALTATADRVTRRDMATQLRMHNPNVFVASFDRPNLSLAVRAGLKAKDKLAELVTFIRSRPNQAGIIYCLSRKNTEAVAEALRAQKIDAVCYHAGMPNHERNKAQDDFLNDRTQVVCATIAFGMGIDKSNVRWVIHYNLPKNIESYYQEIGRGGRDGEPADTILYYNLGDLVLLSRMAQESGQSEINIAKLKRMQQFCEANICRRKILITYFSESLPDNCGNCDVCRHPRALFDGTVLAQKALSVVARTGEKEAVNLLINVLRGSSMADVLEKNYHTIKTWGAGKDISFADWQQYFLQLIQLGTLEIAYDENFALKITDFGREVLFGKQAIQLAEIVREAEDEIREKPRREKKTGSTSNTPVDPELFELLRKLRLDLSKRESVPPFMIFSDAALRDMTEKFPLTGESFLSVSGVGRAKYEKYGDLFLECLRNHARAQGKTLPEKNAVLPPTTFVTSSAAPKVQKGNTYIETLALYRQGLPVEAIAKQRSLNVETIWSHLAYLAESGESVDLRAFVSPATVARVREAVEKTGQDSALRPIFEFLNQEVPYAQIRLALVLLKK